MALYELHMPQMGESILEATILKWMIEEGQEVRQDDIILEVATDKVDSEIPSPVTGKVVELKAKEGDEVPIGQIIAVLETDGSFARTDQDLELSAEEPVAHQDTEKASGLVEDSAGAGSVDEKDAPAIERIADEEKAEQDPEKMTDRHGRFFSPLVRTIAETENISAAELRSIEGTGLEGKVTKADILAYIDHKSETGGKDVSGKPASDLVKVFEENAGRPSQNQALEEVVQMTRVRQTIARHMTASLDTAAHATSVAEADMTNVVKWRERNKDAFFRKHGVKLTYTPVFIKVLARLLREFPHLNASVRGENVILKKYINIGIATALPDHTLIVPVVKNADQYNLIGLAHTANDLVTRARSNDLKADEIQKGTFTLTNIGTFGNLIGTPIINQPEVAILATGAIVKRPSVIETKEGDTIGIRHKMYLSLSFDHRVIDGYMGGSFLKAVADALENFDEEDM